ncbi:branched-subunit amino acid aminotransferase/4-amino-4-deoxychorismate lyase [Krasilnikovia cinnamomea]|uniref:Branched-subunit amino acid aminotransferase/4-amino-4-deoxychorismate lyase n=1 Tax=Krasilnikovia cinnamomea TaxID=349313 RepID=A0A4Q7ZLD8_9ACTN|nr:aminotransferase class IV [Krasilnikovia cinnamomea]RZU51780.1 branched-subunit amino acid aminotransferase/4-amino-4-deoxychorismate lyase [Krasilnikovia cinnamomea]
MSQLNGRPVTPEELQKLALANYGHFTSFRVEDGRVRGLGLHLDRLVRDCDALFGADPGVDRLREFIARGVPGSGIATVRVTVFDPALDLGRPELARDPHILVTRRAADAAAPTAFTAQTTTYVRDAPEIKSVGLFGSLHRRRAARLNGFDDALFVDGTRHVAEGATWNIGLFDGADVIWPDATCLSGVTMRLLRPAHRHRTTPVSVSDLPSMAAAFATNAAIGVREIARIDGVSFGAGHPIIASLRAAYASIPAEPV